MGALVFMSWLGIKVKAVGGGWQALWSQAPGGVYYGDEVLCYCGESYKLVDSLSKAVYDRRFVVRLLLL